MSASLFQNGAPPPDVPRSATHCASVASSSPLDAHVAPVLRKLVRYCGVHAMATPVHTLPLHSLNVNQH